MTYRTHRDFAVCFSLLANIIVYKLHLAQTNYYINLIVLLVFAKQGALFPDVDHNWRNVKEKTVINFVVNKIIHLTGGVHRSWQTHSWDIWLISFVAALYLNNRFLNSVNQTVMILIILGFWSGWFSHLVSDMLSSDGVRLTCLSKKSKIRFVPKQAKLVPNVVISIVILVAAVLIFLSKIDNYFIISFILGVLGIVMLVFSIYMKDKKFNTGGDWELLVYRVTVTLNAIFLVVSVLYPIIPSLVGMVENLN